VLSAADAIVAAGGQIVVTGRGETRFEEALVEAHRRRPDAIGVDIGFDDGNAPADLCRQRFYPDAVTVRAVRIEPDVCAAVWLLADRASDRRPRGNHRGWRNRFPVHAPLNRVVPRWPLPRVRDIRSERSPQLDAPQRHVAIIQLGHFRSLLRRALSKSSITLAHGYAYDISVCYRKSLVRVTG
jgi:hypothetical protein